jgi:hypothetical protein
VQNRVELDREAVRAPGLSLPTATHACSWQQ